MRDFKELCAYLKEEIATKEDGSVKMSTLLNRVLAKERYHYVFWFRIAQYLHNKPRGFWNYKKLGKRINRNLIREHNIDIGLAAQIGPGICFSHRIGIVITHRAIIGRNLRLRQNTTIGSKDHTQGHVRIGDNVEIGANVCIVGEISIGNNVTIGAQAFVNKDIPDNTIYYTEYRPTYRTKQK
jgi:serine acetyltransferase